MDKLEEVHRSFILKETVISIIINATLTGLISYFMFRSQREIEFWGKNGVFVDLISTIFIMTFLMSIVITPVTRARIQKRTAPAAPWKRIEHRVLRYLPGPFLIRGLLFGLLALLVLLPSTTIILVLLKTISMTFIDFVVFKTFLGAFIALLFTPAILIVAMADSE